MKRVIMIMAIATSVSFATQAINPVEKTINPQEVVTQDEFVVIEVKDLPAPVVAKYSQNLRRVGYQKGLCNTN